MEPFIEPNAANDILDPITPDVVDRALARRDPERITWQLAEARSAMSVMRAREPRWASWFDRFVNVVFSADVPSNLGGSTGHAIGVIWMNVAPPVTASDFVEFLTHEMTHQVLFIDDCIQRHYGPAVYTRQAGFARSAIRGSERPLPCVFDSLIVALEILLLRKRVLGEPEAPRFHPSTDMLIAGSWETVRSILDSSGWEQWFSSRGRYWFDVAVESLIELSDPRDVPVEALPSLRI